LETTVALPFEVVQQYKNVGQETLAIVIPLRFLLAHFISPFYLPWAIRSHQGSIINISSIMGFVGSTSGHPAYHASKGAVRIYTKAAAVRYGPSGVRVNTVHPGYMPPMLNATNAGERDDKIAMTPLRRIGKPIEVAYGVLFLASDEASFITGTELVIDGGFIAQ
jgi:NAD(P)-dependent dehydrogenase (short-subunit alcohol dehydrogenase family)